MQNRSAPMTDTIFALSSGGLPSGVAVVRVSGPGAGPALVRLAGRLPSPRRASLRLLKGADGAPLDRGLVLFLPGPGSATGEDMAEFHVHGGRAVVEALARALLGVPGLRPAKAGEFTRRAFANGRLDLTEVEGLADLVEAETEGQRRQALAQAEGALARRAGAWREAVIELRAEVEARLDFADEDEVEEALPEGFVDALAALARDVEAALAGAGRGMRLREGVRVALLGPPNAGKSTLLNALARREVAIVAEEPGTTRDVLEAALSLEGVPLILQDTAGLRETASIAERMGVERALERARAADLVLWVSEGAAEPPPENLGAPAWRIASKADLVPPAPDAYAVAAPTGAGLDRLEEALARFAASVAAPSGDAALSRPRQQAAVAALGLALARAAQPGAPLELVAEALREASDAIGRLTGRIDVEDVLDRLFAGFCIGK